MRLILQQGELSVAIFRHRNSMSLHTGRIIRRLREISGTSQGDLARFSAANLSYISTMESGQNNISIRKVLLLCNALSLSPANLVNIQMRMALAAEMDNQIKEQE